MAHQDPREFEKRKREHLEQALNPKNQAEGLTGLNRFRFIHEALPELSLHDISLSQTSLSYNRKTPLFVSAMTAGHKDAASLNQMLAEACCRRGWAFAVGSQRRELDGDLGRAQSEWQTIRHLGVETFSNLGLAEVISAPVEKVKRLVDVLGASAMVVHLNSLQECVQPGGNPEFRGGLQAIERLCQELTVPVIVKETGCGIWGSTASRLAAVGVSVVDVAGMGGTHWGRIEGRRLDEKSLGRKLSETFEDWGSPTVECLLSVDWATMKTCEVWASGGLRTGLDAAKALALGSRRVGFAYPALLAASEGESALDSWMAQVEQELRVAMLCTGSRVIEDLRKADKWRIQ